MVIETYDEEQQFEIPWDKKQLEQKFETRLILIFEAHTPIWIYYESYEVASIWRDFIIKQRVVKQMENIAQDIPGWTQEIKLLYVEKF